MSEKSRSVEVINQHYETLAPYDGQCFQDKDGWWYLGVGSTLGVGDDKQANRVLASWCSGPAGIVVEDEAVLKLLERIGMRFV